MMTPVLAPLATGSPPFAVNLVVAGAPAAMLAALLFGVAVPLGIMVQIASRSRQREVDSLHPVGAPRTAGDAASGEGT